jgi:hypothetical protein
MPTICRLLSVLAATAIAGKPTMRPALTLLEVVGVASLKGPFTGQRQVNESEQTPVEIGAELADGAFADIQDHGEDHTFNAAETDAADPTINRTVNANLFLAPRVVVLTHP